MALKEGEGWKRPTKQVPAPSELQNILTKSSLPPVGKRIASSPVEATAALKQKSDQKQIPLPSGTALASILQSLQPERA